VCIVLRTPSGDQITLRGPVNLTAAQSVKHRKPVSERKSRRY